jgi:hypothetical protein
MVDIYVRKFNEKNYTKSDTKEYKISSYKPYIMLTSLFYLVNDFYIEKDDYILCPLYSAGDFQIGITGSTQGQESVQQGFIREVAEEIGLIIDTLYASKKEKNNNRSFNTFFANIADCVPVKRPDINASKGRDNSNIKVGGYIHGNRNDILEFMSNKKIYTYINNDDIIGLVAIKVTDILDYLIIEKYS